MNITHVRTGPFKILDVVTDDPDWLIVKFDDINPATGKNSYRKMKRGGEWPLHLSQILEEKTLNLIDQEVIVVTSQTTNDWPTTEYFCDVETTKNYQVRTHIGASLVAADGVSNLLDNLAICEDLNLVDCTFAKEYFSDEDEYNVFFQTLEKRFKSSIANDQLRFVDDDIVRIRLPDKKRDVGSQGGFRVTVWKAIDIEEKNFNYYVILRADRKSLEKKFPEKKEMQELVENVKSLYAGKDLAKIVTEALTGEHSPTIDPVKPAEKTYLNCPFAQKDECKGYGGKWDPEKKKWFVPAGLPLDKFRKWL